MLRGDAEVILTISAEHHAEIIFDWSNTMNAYCSVSASVIALGSLEQMARSSTYTVMYS
jgi:hypothetical protein